MMFFRNWSVSCAGGWSRSDGRDERAAMIGVVPHSFAASTADQRPIKKLITCGASGYTVVHDLLEKAQ
jgi:hypothetical protein